MAQLIWVLLGVATIGLGILTLAGFFGRYRYWLDICDHFRFQYLILAAASATLFYFGGLVGWGSLALFIVMINLYLLFPLYWPVKNWRWAKPQYRILIANVLRSNRAYPEFLALVNAHNPDFIGLVEPDQAWLDGIKDLSSVYPYQYASPRQDNYGLALFSRYLLVETFEHILTEKRVPTLEVQAELDGDRLTIILTHPPPPKNPADTVLRDVQMGRLAELAREKSGKVMLCGDFNCSPWSNSFRKMAHRAQLFDSTRGFGFQPTWPVGRFWLWVPIDHCLVSNSVSVARRWIGKSIGSDHYPLLIDFN
jgi:endonuclease/exonuclease/phosphatase (EEP) superfamily protein YafD